MHEHVARVMYYCSVQLLFASCVGVAAWVLTSIRGASATAKYWIWVVTAFTFMVPLGAFIDKLWTRHLAWAAPLGVIGGPIWDMTQGRTAVILAVTWITGAFVMIARLTFRLHKERGAQARGTLGKAETPSGFLADGISVRFDRHPVPAACGILHPHIVLPVGIDRLLSSHEFNAVLLHEAVHARRRDNLLRLIYEVSLCVFWFHPMMWLIGARMALYRELSCDESVIRRQHGQALVSALAKLAVPEPALFLQATASSHLSHRLARLAEPLPATHRGRSLLMTLLFAAVVAVNVFGTVAHTACCFVLKHSHPTSLPEAHSGLSFQHKS